MGLAMLDSPAVASDIAPADGNGRLFKDNNPRYPIPGTLQEKID
jgi:hypothetical protein